MKKLLYIMPLLFLSACGMHEFRDGDPLISLAEKVETTKAACYAARNKTTIYPSNMAETTVIMLEQQKSFERIIGAVTGKDECNSGTNLNDVLIADVKARNESLRSLGGGIVDLGMMGVGAWALTDVVRSTAGLGGTTTSIGGDDNSIGRDNNNLTNGEGGTLNLTGDTRTDTTTTTTSTSTVTDGSN